MTTQLDLELSTLRRRRRSPGLVAWLRALPMLDRRTIRDPDQRDAYWTTVQQRLAESDAASLRRHRELGPPPRG